MKRIFIAASCLISAIASAGGWSNPAVPTRVDVERGNGLMIYGAFGNPDGCVVSDQIYVRIDHPQYKQIYAAALSAFAGKFRIQAYAATCDSVSWYSLPSVTYNILDASASLNIME